MARQRMVTRTIEVTKVHALCVNLNTHEVDTVSVVINSLNRKATDAQILDIVKAYISEDLMPCKVEGKEVAELIYGMPEDEFIRGAQIIER